MPRRAVILGLASILLSNVADAASPWRQEMIWRLRVDDRLTHLLAVCPADVAGARAARGTAVGTMATVDCQRDPVACHQRCEARDGEACLNLARAIEAEEPRLSPNFWKPLYTAACELGQASGCTNRAAALRNLEGPDPLDHVAEPAAHCEFRSFQYACAHDDAWGCTMLGQALLNGEGIAASPGEAHAMFAKACAIDLDFEACEFARKMEAPTQ